MSVLTGILLVGSLALLAAWILAWPVLGTWFLIARVARRYGLSWAHYTPGIVAFPLTIGLALAVGAFVPVDPHLGHVLACHCDLSHPGWLHLCPVHPAASSQLLLALAVPAILLAFRPMLAMLRLHANHGSFSSSLGPGVPRSGGVRLVELGLPLAFTTGLLRPVFAADRDYWSALDETTRRVIRAHEMSHVRRRDPLTHAWLIVWTAFAPRLLAVALVHDWLRHAETRADRHAAQVVGDPLVVADVLVQQRRVQMQVTPPAMAWSAGNLEQRVHTLLSGAPGPHVPRTDLDAPSVLVPAVIAVASVAALSPWLHHTLEHLINTLF